MLMRLLRPLPALAGAAIAHLADRIQINVEIGDMPQGRFG